MLLKLLPNRCTRDRMLFFSVIFVPPIQVSTLLALYPRIACPSRKGKYNFVALVATKLLKVLSFIIEETVFNLIVLYFRCILTKDIELGGITMIKKLIFPSLIATVFLTACGSNEDNIAPENTAWNAIQESGTMTVATAGTLFPTSYHSEDDQLTGYEVELVKEIASILDVEVEFEEIGVDTMTQALNSGRVHIAANSLTKTDEREQNFDFSTPYKYSFGSAIVREEDLSGIETLEDLDGKIALGAMNTTYMQKAEEYGATPKFFDNVTNDVYLRAVENGQGDVILNDYYLQSITVNHLTDIDVQVHPTLFYDPSEQGIMLAKNEPLLLEAINDAITQLIENGTATSLSEEFFDGYDVTQLPDIDFE